MTHISRRSFLQSTLMPSVVVVAALGVPQTIRASITSRQRAHEHPTPRPGITGANVLTAQQLSASLHLVVLFDGIRAIPSIADGIRCNCGCAELPGFYSLLSCFERDGMARSCPICQGQGRVTVRLYHNGKTLAEIRSAIDAQFG